MPTRAPLFGGEEDLITVPAFLSSCLLKIFSTFLTKHLKILTDKRADHAPERGYFDVAQTLMLSASGQIGAGCGTDQTPQRLSGA
jgi:hypothetical protein